MSHIFHIQTFGCQMNAHDSDWLTRSLVACGFAQGDFDDASIYIINTCSVRDKPEQKVYSELGRIARICKVLGRTNVTVCVGGCVAQQVGPKLARRFPQVRLLFGTDGIARAPEAISRLMEEPGLRLSLLDFVDKYEERQDIRINSGPDSKPASAPSVPPAAFVNIMQGCDNFCTYCIVPYVRGRQKSRDPEAVLAECRSLLENGAREITLLGQNVNSYGQDIRTGGASFAGLLREVAELPNLARLRFVTPHPKDIAPDVIDAFASMPVLCPRLHLPLQSGSDRILAAMGRRYDTVRYLDIVARLKEARPDMVLSTDIIVGFPGETEDDFQNTLDIMRTVGFAASYSFVYSDRPHARAALLSGKVDRPTALDRLSRLQDWQNQASDQVLASLQDREFTILVESRSRRATLPDDSADTNNNARERTSEESNGQHLSGQGEDPRDEAWQGKTPHGFIVNVPLPSFPQGTAQTRGWEGALLPVRIESAARHSLKGKQAGAPW